MTEDTLVDRIARCSYSPECNANMHHACGGCNGCICHYEITESYDPINDDRVNDHDGD